MDENTPLTFETRDEFHRKGVAEKAINLLLSDVDVSPMVIDGKWGTGKTEFSEKFVHLLGETTDDIHCTYVDAFKADHADNPLITLIAAVANLIEDPQQQESFVQQAIPAVRYGLKTLGKAGVAWFLKQNAEDIADEFEATVKQVGEDSINASAERLVKEHQNAEENLDALKAALIQVSEETPLVIFIDELDRCRPDFAVAILEHIKHVFDVPNVQFVLVANLEQLKASINHCYGLGVDAQRYLDKFIKFSFKLSPLFSQDRHNFTIASVEHAKNLIREHPTLSDSELKHAGYQELIETLVSNNRLSLRETETFIRYIDIYNVLTNGEAFPERLIFGYGLLRLLGVYYFCFHPGICDELDHDVVDGEKMSKPFGVISHTKFADADPRNISLALGALIFLDSTKPVTGLDLSDEDDIREWNADIGGLFRNGGFPPRQGNRVSIISEVIRQLRMTG